MSLIDLMKNVHDTYNIWLDDIRMPPDGDWLVARTAEEAYVLVCDAYMRGCEIVLSLDHDLGEDIPTGDDLLNWLERDIVTTDFRPNISFRIHSANPVGRQNMARAIQTIKEILS